MDESPNNNIEIANCSIFDENESKELISKSGYGKKDENRGGELLNGFSPFRNQEILNKYK